jgi:hypothetical protein
VRAARSSVFGRGSDADRRAPAGTPARHVHVCGAPGSSACVCACRTSHAGGVRCRSCETPETDTRRGYYGETLLSFWHTKTAVDFCTSTSRPPVESRRCAKPYSKYTPCLLTLTTHDSHCRSSKRIPPMCPRGSCFVGFLRRSCVLLQTKRRHTHATPTMRRVGEPRPCYFFPFASFAGGFFAAFGSSHAS